MTFKRTPEYALTRTRAIVGAIFIVVIWVGIAASWIPFMWVKSLLTLYGVYCRNGGSNEWIVVGHFGFEGLVTVILLGMFFSRIRKVCVCGMLE